MCSPHWTLFCLMNRSSSFLSQDIYTFYFFSWNLPSSGSLQSQLLNFHMSPLQRPSSGHLIQRSPHDSYGLSQRALIGLKLPKYLLTCLASLLTAVLGPCLPFLASLYWLWQLTQNLRWPTGRLLEIWAWERSWSNTTFVLRILWKTHRVYRCPTDPTISHSSSSYVTSWFLE